MKTNKVFVIAEAGVNHNGSVSLAKKLIDAAKKAGADAVKFQTYKTELLVTARAPKAQYQLRATSAREGQWDMLKKLELSESAFRRLAAHCRRRGILFMSSPFDLESVDFLASLRMPIFKIPSGEITNLPYLRKVGGLGKKIIMSTGMSTLKEVERALEAIVAAGTPRRRVTLLHCTTEYPAPFQDVNLLAMSNLKEACGTAVGYSDHTLGTDVALAAVGLGARVIEKHLTLSRRMAGPDHAASLEPAEFAGMVAGIRRLERALGSPVKKPTSVEMKNRIVRKSLVAARDIRKGERFTDLNVAAKRPGTGLSPMRWDAVLGQRAKRDFARDEAIRL